MVEYGRIWLPHFGFAGDRVGYVRVCGVYLAGVSLAVIMFHYVGCDLSHPHLIILINLHFPTDNTYQK